jgi:lambda family phage portal protein
MTKVIEAAELAEIESLLGTGGDTPMAFGGAYDGANRFDRKVAGWVPPLQSADAEMMPDKGIIDARSRDLNRNDAFVQGGGTLHKDSIVGDMFALNSKPNWAVLGLSEEWAEAFQQECEEKFTTWAESPRKYVDYSEQNDFTALIRLSVGVYTSGGEALATAEWDTSTGRDFRTAVQMVDTDRLMQPHIGADNPLIRGGIEHDRRGRHKAYFIRTYHPSDYRNVALANGQEYKKVGARKPWGRAQVLYVREQMRVDQTRAVSDMVAGLKEIKMMRGFRDVTLQNAVVNAMYAATIESELPSEALFSQLGGGNIGESAADFGAQYLGAINEYVGNAKHMMIDGVRVPHLFPGTKFKMQPAGTPGGVGQEFEKSLLRYLASSLNVSYEELSKDYTKTNYSAVRAAMASSHRFMQARKRVCADAMANGIFRLWLEEAVNNDKLDSFPASMSWMLYTDGVLNYLFDALANCSWIGASRGQIDELKETQAATLRIKWGLSTHEDELARLGKDWRKVYAQLEREAKERKKRNIELIEDNSVNAASGSARETDETDDKEGDTDDE